MIPWGVLFARQVARALEEDPRRDLSAAVEQAGRRLESSLPQALLVQAREEFERLMKEDPPVFRRRYLLNPRYLAEKLGKRVFIYLVDGRDGRYRTLRRSLQGWKGEHSRFILFGPQDVMVVLYGTEEENGEFLRAFSEENWPVDIIQVESISRWYGRPVPEYRDVPLDQEALQAATRVLQGEESSELEPVRQRLQEAGILLGPVVVENLKKTGRMRAFVGVRIMGGPFPAVIRQFEQLLLGSEYRTAVRSIYHCAQTHHHLLLELICEDVRELDRVTEWMQQPPGATFQVETTTFVVAETEVEVFPTLALAPARQEPLEQDLALTWGRPDLIRVFRALPENWQLFLRYAREEYTGARSALPPQHQEGIEHAWRMFVLGVLERAAPKVQDAYLEAARILEESLREALRRMVEWVYGKEHGQGQRELKLPHARFHELSLGQILEALEKVAQSRVYQALGLEIPRPVMRELRFVQDLRNELAHRPVPAMVDAELWVFARRCWDGFTYVLHGLGWVQAQIFDRRVILMERLPDLIQATRDPQAAQWPLASEEEVREVISRLMAMQEQLGEVRGRVEELARLPALSSPSPQGEFWMKRMEEVVQRQEEILRYLRPDRQDAARGLLQRLSEAGASLGLNLAANALWSLLAWAQPERLLDLLRWLAGR
jgi:DNA-binding Lrp family transcriptional regulator/CheY-like chemotaxis protein